MAIRTITRFCFIFSFIFALVLPLTTAAVEDRQKPAPPKDEKVAVEDVIPLTAGNMRGHKMLYNEGWYVVTSSSKAFDYAREKSIISSKKALEKAAEQAAKHSVEYKEALKSDVQDSAKTGTDLVVSGTRQTGRILEATHELVKGELVYAQDGFKKAVDSFVRGNLTLAKRTEEDRQELANMPGNYFKDIKSDFSNVYELAESARARFGGKIDPAWEDAFSKASREFQGEYEKSGKEQNTLTALGPVLYGYLKSFYYGLAAPASKTIVKTAATGTSYAVFLPVSATAIVAGRTVQSVGLTVYYVGKTGVNIVSPTIEGGLLSGLSLLSLGSVPVTYAAGGALGAVNQVAFTTAGPVAGVAEGVGSTAAHTAGYVGFLTYDAAAGTTKVVINQAASGIVLGYNALTAVPAHALMGVVDGVVLLAYDGPRLLLAKAQGRVKSGKDGAAAETYSLGDLPVGTVVDLKTLEQTEGVKVEVLSTDPAVIKDVLERISDDARGAK
jgi:hypothetical protein